MTNTEIGTMVVLAYPEAFCTMPPSWYRPLLSGIGIIHDNKICAGHSAILLISKITKRIIYTDFGRYITADGMGRARNYMTDPEVKFDIKAKFHYNGQLANLDEILKYTNAHPEKTHGKGVLYASVHDNINFDSALELVYSFMDKGSIPYAPFSIGASNCSRYVGSIINSSLNTTEEKIKFRLRSLPVSSPLSNVYYGKSEQHIYKLENNEIVQISAKNRKNSLSYFINTKPNSSIYTSDTLTAPGRHFQWLSGIGAGSWFGLTPVQKDDQLFRIQRINKEGQLSFDQIFKSEDDRFNSFDPYQFIYDCNALLCTVLQDGYKIRMNALRL